MNYLELIGTLTGIAYLWLEYRASIYLWIAGLIMPAIYLFVYYRAGLYADFGINVYYLLASFYGLYCWMGRGHTTQTVSENVIIPTRTPKRLYGRLLLLSVLLLFGIAGLLIRFTDSNVPWLDSFTTALSIVAMWMLARKYVEQWLVWIGVDAVSCGLYVYKALYFTAVLYGIYTIIAVLGYRKWKQLIKKAI